MYEHRLIKQHLKESGKCPVSGEELDETDLILLKGSKIVRPRPVTATSVPGMLTTLQSEWDDLMLETFTLKSTLDATRQELSHALYQHDAACRVIARLMRERDEAQALVGALQAAGYQPAGHNGNMSSSTSSNRVTATATQGEGSGPMEAAQDDSVAAPAAGGISATILQSISSKYEELSAARKARKAAEKAAGGTNAAKKEAIASFVERQGFTSHKADSKTGVTALAVSASYACGGGESTAVVLSGATDKTVALTESHSGRVLARLTGHSKKVTAVAFHPQSANLFSASTDKTVKMWQPSEAVPTTGRSRGKAAQSAMHFEEAFSWSSGADEGFDCGEVVGMVVHPCGAILLSASQRLGWHVIDCASGRTVVGKVSQAVEDEQYTCCGLHPDGLILGTGSSAGAVQIWDIRKQDNVASLFDAANSGGAVCSVSFSENGYSVATGTADGLVKIWDLRKLVCSKTIEVGSHSVTSVSYDPSAQFLAACGSGSAGGGVVVLAVKEDWSRVLDLPDAHAKTTQAVSWAADSTALFSGSMDRTIKMWSA